MKTIEVDPLDIQSINKAIDALKAHETWRKQKISEYVRRLCEIGADAARTAYGGAVSVNVMPDGSGIIAQGSQTIFLEFGAGFYTEDHGLSDPLSNQIIIAPGGWSETEGEKTWSEWVAAGKPLEKYPYNQRPRAGMLAAYNAIISAQNQIAKEVFERD